MKNVFNEFTKGWNMRREQAFLQYQEAKVPKSFNDGFMKDIQEREDFINKFQSDIDAIKSDKYLNIEGKKYRIAEIQDKCRENLRKLAGRKQFDLLIEQDMAKLTNQTVKALEANDEKRHQLALQVFNRLEMIREKHTQEMQKRIKKGEMISDEAMSLDAARIEVERIIEGDHADRQLIMAIVLNSHPMFSCFSPEETADLRHQYAATVNPEKIAQIASNQRLKDVFETLNAGVREAIDSAQAPILDPEAGPKSMDDFAAIIGQTREAAQL